MSLVNKFWSIITWHTSSSIPSHIHCTWPRQFCTVERSQGPGDRQGWGHIRGSRWREEPWRLSALATTGSGECPDRWPRWSWCSGDKYEWWRWTWEAWMDSPWESLCLGKIPLLDKTERDNRGVFCHLEKFIFLPSKGESGGPRMVACQWKASSPTGPEEAKVIDILDSKDWTWFLCNWDDW